LARLVGEKGVSLRSAGGVLELCAAGLHVGLLDLYMGKGNAPGASENASAKLATRCVVERSIILRHELARLLSQATDEGHRISVGFDEASTHHGKSVLALCVRFTAGGVGYDVFLALTELLEGKSAAELTARITLTWCEKVVEPQQLLGIKQSHLFNISSITVDNTATNSGKVSGVSEKQLPAQALAHFAFYRWRLRTLRTRMSILGWERVVAEVCARRAGAAVPTQSAARAGAAGAATGRAAAAAAGADAAAGAVAAPASVAGEPEGAPLLATGRAQSMAPAGAAGWLARRKQPLTTTTAVAQLTAEGAEAEVRRLERTVCWPVMKEERPWQPEKLMHVGCLVHMLHLHAMQVSRMHRLIDNGLLRAVGGKSAQESGAFALARFMSKTFGASLSPLRAWLAQRGLDGEWARASATRFYSQEQTMAFVLYRWDAIMDFKRERSHTLSEPQQRELDLLTEEMKLDFRLGDIMLHEQHLPGAKVAATQTVGDAKAEVAKRVAHARALLADQDLLVDEWRKMCGRSDARARNCLILARAVLGNGGKRLSAPRKAELERDEFEDVASAELSQDEAPTVEELEKFTAIFEALVAVYERNDRRAAFGELLSVAEQAQAGDAHAENTPCERAFSGFRRQEDKQHQTRVELTEALLVCKMGVGVGSHLANCLPASLNVLAAARAEIDGWPARRERLRALAAAADAKETAERARRARVDERANQMVVNALGREGGLVGTWRRGVAAVQWAKLPANTLLAYDMSVNFDDAPQRTGWTAVTIADQLVHRNQKPFGWLQDEALWDAYRAGGVQLRQDGLLKTTGTKQVVLQQLRAVRNVEMTRKVGSHRR
jgi:hypothetical protein